MKFLKWLWNSLAEKGRIATLIGFGLTFPVNGWSMVAFFSDWNVPEAKLWQIVIINAVGMVWFILPSKIIIESGKGLKIQIED